MSDDEDFDIIAQQAALAEAKFGGLKKKAPIVQTDKTAPFNSGDYFMQQEALKKAAGLESQEEKKEEQKE